MARKYKLTISMTQETDGEADNKTIIEEFSDEGSIHIIKTQVFTKHFTNAVNAATQELLGMALSAGVDSTGKPQKEDQNFVR